MGFTVQILKPDDPYCRHWLEIRRRAKVFGITLVLWLPVASAITLFASLVFGDNVAFWTGPASLLLVMGAWIGAIGD